MAEPVHVIIQMRSTPSLAAASFGAVAAAPAVFGISDLPGVQFDAGYSPVPIPPRPTAGAVPGMATAFTVSEPPSYVLRATVQSDALADFLDSTNGNPAVVGVFADPRIQPIAV